MFVLREEVTERTLDLNARIHLSLVWIIHSSRKFYQKEYREL